MRGSSKDKGKGKEKSRRQTAAVVSAPAFGAEGTDSGATAAYNSFASAVASRDGRSGTFDGNGDGDAGGDREQQRKAPAAAAPFAVSADSFELDGVARRSRMASPSIRLSTPALAHDRAGAGDHHRTPDRQQQQRLSPSAFSRGGWSEGGRGGISDGSRRRVSYDEPSAAEDRRVEALSRRFVDMRAMQRTVAAWPIDEVEGLVIYCERLREEKLAAERRLAEVHADRALWAARGMVSATAETLRGGGGGSRGGHSSYAPSLARSGVGPSHPNAPPPPFAAGAAYAGSIPLGGAPSAAAPNADAFGGYCGASYASGGAAGGSAVHGSGNGHHRPHTVYDAIGHAARPQNGRAAGAYIGGATANMTAEDSAFVARHYAEL